jgi:streptomycin 6-kinase
MVVVPERLRWLADNWGDSAVRRWLGGLPSRIEQIQDKWRIEVGRPYEPGGYTAWVAPATLEDGSDCVLKIMFPFEGHAREADALRIWDGNAAVRVLRGERFELLLERCNPGVPLATLDVHEADAIAADVLIRLWRPPTVDGSWVTVAELGPRIAADIRRDSARRDVPFDRGIASHAADFADAAGEWEGPDLFLHGDFHHSNVLSASRERWLAIDPKPRVGDPSFDAAFLLVDRAEDILTSDRPDKFVARRIESIADRLDLDRQMLAQWALVRCTSLVLNALADSWSFGMKRIDLVGVLASQVGVGRGL